MVLSSHGVRFATCPILWGFSTPWCIIAGARSPTNMQCSWEAKCCGHFGWSSAADRLGTDTLPNPTLPFVCCVYISKWYNIYSHIRYSHCFASCLERSYQNPETNGCFWGLLKVDNLSISSLHSNFSQPSAMGTGTHLGLHQRSLRLELHTNWQSYRSQSASLEKYFQVSSISTSTVCQLNFIRFAEHAVQPTLHAVPTNHFSSDVCTVST